MADLRLFANTSNIVRFVLKHSTTGQGLAGLTSASSGLIISTIADNEATAPAYTAAGSTIETITTLGTFATPTATKCRFKEVDSVNHKGLYEFQFADARFAVASSRRLVISVTGAANLLDTDYEIQLVRFDPYDAVRLGLTALPNVAAATAGGLSADIAAVSALITAVKAKTDQLVFTIANKVDSSIQAAGDFAQAAADKVWLSAIRILTAGTNIILAKGTGVTGFNDLSAADIRTATGLASANLDTQLGAIDGVTDKLDTTLEVDGLVYRFTTNALEQAPAGGGGGGTGLINFVYGGEWVLNQQNRIDFYLQSSAGAAVVGLGAGFTLTLAKNGGAFAASAGTKAEIGGGWYTYLATAGEANTIGTIAAKAVGAGAVEQNLEYVVKQRTAGAIAYTYTVTNSVTTFPVEGVAVWVTTDIAGGNVIWVGTTDAAGVARDSGGSLPYLDPGVYFFWKQKSGFVDADMPDQETVS